MNKYAFPYITNASFRMGELDKKLKHLIRDEYENTSVEDLHHYAKKRKILPFVANLMVKMELDKNYWNAITEQYRKRNTAVMEALDQVFRQFLQYGVKRAFVSQNFGAVLAAETDISLFASGDVDMCGDISEKEQIDRAFQDLGYTQKDRYCGKKLVSSDYYNDHVLPQGFAIGMEYDTLTRLKLPNPIGMMDFVDWNRTVHYKNTNIVLPSIEALTYICLVHISLHSFSREPDIRLYVDIENCLSCNPALEKIMSFAKKDGTVVRVLAAYLITANLFEHDTNDNIWGQDYEKYASRTNRLIHMVYDSRKNALIYEPSHFRTLQIECAYYDHPGGLLQMLFPDKNWMREVYGSNHAAAHFKHLMRLIM